MSGSAYEVIKYTPEFREQVLELQKHLWSQDIEMNSAYLEWKYEKNPYLDTPLIFLVMHSGRAVAMRGVYGANWLAGYPAQVVPACCVGDLVVDPEHRGRFLFFKIMRAAVEEVASRGCGYLFGLSGSLVTQRLALRAGFRKVGMFSMMRRESDPGNQAPSRSAQPGRTSDPAISLEPAPRPESMADLVARIGTDGRIRHARDSTYFAWRFQNPLCEYRFLFWDRTRLEGYLVLQRSLNRQGRGLHIVEWEATNLRVREDLLRAAIAGSNREALSLWPATLPQAGIRLLENNRFLPYTRRDGHPHGLLVKAIPPFSQPSGQSYSVNPPGGNPAEQLSEIDANAAGRNLWNFADWDLRMTYSDAY